MVKEQDGLVERFLDVENAETGEARMFTLDEAKAVAAAYRQLEAQLSTAREDVLREALDCQPCTAEDPNESDYQRGRFDGIIDFSTAILALIQTPEGDG